MFLMLNLTDLLVVGFLVVLEAMLSLDNALVLAIMVKHLPPARRAKALTYGVWGAIAFRFLALFALSWLMSANWIKAVGGVYLLWIAIKNRLWADTGKVEKVSFRNFWATVAMVEIMDVAFSADSILAAVSLSKNYWVLVAGGVLGIITMRFAAMGFVGLLQRFPRLEQTAYVLVGLIGMKLLLDAFKLPGVDFHSASSPASWIFWCLLVWATLSGLRTPARRLA